MELGKGKQITEGRMRERESGKKQMGRERGRELGGGKKGKRESYHSIRPIYFSAHNSTNPSDARFPLVLGSFQPAFTLCASCTWTLYIYRRAPCATKTRNSAFTVRACETTSFRAFVYSKLRCFFFFFFFDLLNATWN